MWLKYNFRYGINTIYIVHSSFKISNLYSIEVQISLRGFRINAPYVWYLKVVQVKYRNKMVSSYLRGEHKCIHGRHINVECRLSISLNVQHWCMKYDPFIRTNGLNKTHLQFKIYTINILPFFFFSKVKSQINLTNVSHLFRRCRTGGFHIPLFPK